MKISSSTLQGKMCCVLLIWFDICIACSGSKVESILVVDSAKNVQKIVAEGGSRVQITYQVDLPFPKLAVNKPVHQSLQSHGWLECESKGLGWIRYVDKSKSEPEIIHSNVKYFSRNNTLVTAASKYHSEFQDSIRQAPPDNQTQTVIILIDKFLQNELFSEAIDRLGIDCVDSTIGGLKE